MITHPLRLLKKITGSLALFILLLGVAAPALAQEPTPVVITDDEVNAIAEGMYCPVCANTPLDVCETQACYQWRELIRQQLGEGWTEKEIKAYFVEQYGDRVLAEPPARGLNWLVYIVPPLVILGGIFFVVQIMRSWKKNPPQVESGLPTLDIEDEYLQRIEESLKDRD